MLQKNRDGLTRKQFLQTAALAALLPLLPRIDRAEAKAIGVTEVAPGIYVHHGNYEEVDQKNAGDIANMIFIVGAESVAVVDTGTSAHLGQSLRDAISSVTKLPVRYVINTHMHPDHVFGNIAFKDAQPEFVAHHKLARALAVRAQGYLMNFKDNMGAANFAGTEVVLPTRPIAEPTEIDLGNRKLALVPRPTAHTDNDMTVHDSTTGIMVIGDLIFSRRIPTIDGSIVGWLKLLDTLNGEDFTHLIPGHGPTIMEKSDAIPPLKHYLNTVATEVRAAIKAGKSLSETSKTAALSEKNDWLLFDENNRRNVTAAFAELEWE
jgi:quinoprotein relay system zinc metallohydrolase 2